MFYAADGKVVLSSGKHFTCETPLLRQVYDALDVAGKAGLTISELMKQFGLNYCDCRNLLKNVCRKGLAVFTMHDQGKNEVRRFVFYALCLCACIFQKPDVKTSQNSLCMLYVDMAVSFGDSTARYVFPVL